MVRLAAHDARQKLFALAAPLLEAKPEELDAADGKIFVAAQPSRSVTFKQAAAKMPGEVDRRAVAERKKQFETYRADLAGTPVRGGRGGHRDRRGPRVKMVSVNDCGLPINTLTTESQIIGGMIQGVSWALFENRILDRNVGTMVNPNLESYKILGAQGHVRGGGDPDRGRQRREQHLGRRHRRAADRAHAGRGRQRGLQRDAARACARLPITPDRVLAALAEARQR